MIDIRRLLYTQVAVENLPTIVELLSDHFPSFIEIYLYVVQKQSKIISRASKFLVTLMIVHTEDPAELQAGLSDIVKVSEGALNQLSIVGNWSIYQDVVHNLQQLLDTNAIHDNPRDFQSIAKHLLAHWADKNLSVDNLRMIVAVWLKINKVYGDPDDIRQVVASTIRVHGNWMALGFLLEGVLQMEPRLDIAVQLVEVGSQADDKLMEGPEDVVDIINVKHLTIIGQPFDLELCQKMIELMEWIETGYLKAETELPCHSTFIVIFRVSVNLILKMIRHLSHLTNILQRFEDHLHGWVHSCITQYPDSLDWQLHMVTLCQFTLIWKDEDTFSQLLVVQLKVSSLTSIK